jgi:glycerol-3-phosphate dehydrogenase
LPQLNSRVKFTATYHDASLPEPERLAIDVLLDGLDANPLARAVNYVAAVSAGERGIRLRDEESGEEFEFTADFVVNVTGPWTDLTNQALGAPTDLLGGTKGSHIVLDSPELLAAIGGREIFFENSDGRIVLIYPVNGRVLVGTTDLEADPAEPPACTDEEVAYFFDLIAHVFPTVHVGREQIVFRYAGIRPLPNHGDLRPGFVSRDYRLVDTPLADGALPTISLVGGKWTTFRALGTHLAGEVMQRLGIERTADLSEEVIGGARGFPDDADRAAWLSTFFAGWPEGRGESLLRRYGTRARTVAASEIVFGEAALAGGLTSGELRYLVDRERVRHVIDLVVRRTDLAFRGEVTREMIADLARALGALHGWSAKRIAREVADTVALLNERHGLELA